MAAIFDDYNLLELIQRWAAETQEAGGRLAKLLAHAILSGELPYKLSPDESLLIVRDGKGAVLPNAYLPEAQNSMVIAGAERVQLSELSETMFPESTVHAWVRDQLDWVRSHPSEPLRPMLRILLLRRHDVAEWLRQRGISPPQFLEPGSPAQAKAQGDTRPCSADQPTKPAGLSEKQHRNERWIAKTRELRRQDPALPVTTMAKLIANDRGLNPEDRDWQTVRRILTRDM